MNERKLSISDFGFTLIELLIIISIMGILMTTGVAYYQNFNRRQIVIQTAKELKNNLRLAQSRALAGEKDCAIGVCGGTIIGCGNDGAEKTLVGWFVDFSAEEIYGKCGSTKFMVTSFAEDIPDNVSISWNTNPIQFSPLTQGVTASILCVSGFDQFYKLEITTSGEIIDTGLSASCP